MSSFLLIFYTLVPSIGLSLLMFSFKERVEERHRGLFSILCVFPPLATIIFLLSMPEHDAIMLSMDVYYLSLVAFIIIETYLLTHSYEEKK